MFTHVPNWKSTILSNIVRVIDTCITTNKPTCGFLRLKSVFLWKHRAANATHEMAKTSPRYTHVPRIDASVSHRCLPVRRTWQSREHKLNACYLISKWAATLMTVSAVECSASAPPYGSSSARRSLLPPVSSSVPGAPVVASACRRSVQFAAATTDAAAKERRRLIKCRCFSSWHSLCGLHVATRVNNKYLLWF